MKTHFLAAAAAVALALATPAAATQFVGSDSVTTNTSDPGLVVYANPINSNLNFSLNVGQSTTIKLFNLYTNETAVNPDDLSAKPINVAFNFTLPTNFGGSVNGETAGTTSLFGIFQDGVLTWDHGGNLAMNFGNGGELDVHVNGGEFNKGLFGLDEGPRDGLTVSGTFKYVASAVPEPMSWALMLTGFFGLGAMLRANRRHAAFAA